eukprot:tig00021038_g17545.t1
MPGASLPRAPADVSVSPKFDARGIAFLLVALASDAFLGNVQEKMLTRHGVSSAEMCACSYAVAAGLNLLVVLATGSSAPPSASSRGTPPATGASSSGDGLGLLPDLAPCEAKPLPSSPLPLRLRLGPSQPVPPSAALLRLVVVTSCRKLLTICLSFIFYPKPWSNLYLVSSLLLFSGTLLNVYAKHPAEARRLAARAAERWGAWRGRRGAPDIEEAPGD